MAASRSASVEGSGVEIGGGGGGGGGTGPWGPGPLLQQMIGGPAGVGGPPGEPPGGGLIKDSIGGRFGPSPQMGGSGKASVETSGRGSTTGVPSVASEGSPVAATGSAGSIERRLPQRVRAKFFPSERSS